MLIVFVFPLPVCGPRERLRTHSIESSGKLKISAEQHCDFTAEDLKDLGEIGRGAYGSVNKMVHKPSNQIMAVKVIPLAQAEWLGFGSSFWSLTAGLPRSAPDA